VTWTQAQSYCRQHHTDLASGLDQIYSEEFKKLLNSTGSKVNSWIGLFRDSWRWSDGSNFSFRYWDMDSFNDGLNNRTCATTLLERSGRWSSAGCDHRKPFFCYDGEFTQIYLTLNYCRQKHHDLVSISNPHQQQWVQERAKNASTPFVWLGLDSWRWSDGSNFSFRYWDMDSFNDGLNNRKCATTLLERSGRWSSAGCDHRKPFFCYDDKLILIRENQTWEKALNYCRQTHHDLVSISNPEEQRWVQERAKNASTPFVWLGLQYSCAARLWLWVTDYVVCYGRWASGGRTEDCGMSAAMTTGGQHEWVSQRKNETFNFICIKH
uniref:C-type lectin domain-containing protein n=1 Tax=Pundamilia nyererei TaxID=303518 RepID=A0A3B4FID5_9CICH